MTAHGSSARRTEAETVLRLEQENRSEHFTLLERAGASVIGCSFVIDLPELGGADKLRALGKPVSALVAFEGH